MLSARTYALSVVCPGTLIKIMPRGTEWKKEWMNELQYKHVSTYLRAWYKGEKKRFPHRTWWLTSDFLQPSFSLDGVKKFQSCLFDSRAPWKFGLGPSYASVKSWDLCFSRNVNLKIFPLILVKCGERKSWEKNLELFGGHLTNFFCEVNLEIFSRFSFLEIYFSS
jgi:hypothetical protein